jgi:putative DNA primase/helicase
VATPPSARSPRDRKPDLWIPWRPPAHHRPKAIHRTALRADGTGKADLPGLGNAKRMLGPAKDAGLKLTRDTDVTDGLGIAEGIETALTIVCAGWRPVWACGSAGAIEKFPILPGIESLTIFADADRAGMAAATACQTRWVKAGFECRILAPPELGADWNDMVGVTRHDTR